MRVQFIKIVFVISLLCVSTGMFSQSADTSLPYYDTSGYFSSDYLSYREYNLMIAAAAGYDKEIDRLIEKGALINAETDKGATPLIFAVTNDRFTTVNTLLKYNPDLDKITRNYETPLIIAVKSRFFEITEALIRAGADIDLPDRNGATPIHYAALNGYTEIVDLLLYYHADIDVKSDEGTTPLLVAIRAGYDDVSDLLLQNGADVDAGDNDGFTPFLMATFYSDTLLMDQLYKKGADIYATNKVNHNALTLSILTGQTYITKFLFEIGNKWGKSGGQAINPYTVAAKYRRKDVINILEKNNVPGKIQYGFDQAAVTVASKFDFRDIYTSFSLALKEPYLDLGIIAGLDTKLWYTRVLLKSSENLFYQYMDKGSVVYAGVFKDLALTDRVDRFNIALSGSLVGGYSFGNKLKGTLLTPDNKFVIMPSISVKMVRMNFTFITGLEYMKTGFWHNGPLWFKAGISYNYFFDKVRTQIKPLRWY